MSENEKTKWRLSMASDQRDIASSLHQQKSRKKGRNYKKEYTNKSRIYG
jgi:hypothetical protein